MKEKNLYFYQLKALLKKDISLLFRKRVAIFIFGGPFLLMFLLIGLPSLFGSEQSFTLLVYSDDLGYGGNLIGDAIIGNLSEYYLDISSIEVELVENSSSVFKTKDLGLYIPENFSEFAYLSVPILYTVDAIDSLQTSTVFQGILTIAEKVMITFLANRTVPDINPIPLQPQTSGDEIVYGPKATAIAYPLGYMLFLLIALNSSSNSLIGFAREKRMRTLELLLSYTYNHSFLVISKTITAIIASLGSTLSYVLGIVVGTSLGSAKTSGLFDVFGFNMSVLGVWDIIIGFIAVVVALLISTLITMAVDCNLAREAAERLSPLVSIGLAMFFYFVVLMNPLATSTGLMINPFFWCYRIGLLIISGIWNYEIILYSALILGLMVVLIRFATKGIQKEKSLYLD